MGCHGIFGFVLDGQEKVSEIGADAYPSAAGVDYLRWLRAQMSDLDNLAAWVRRLRLVPEGVELSPDERARAERRLEPLSVAIDWSDGELRWEWPYFTPLDPRKPVPDAYTCGIVSGLMIDAAWMLTDPLYCEWGYLADLDRRSFEVYEGSQQEPHTVGRFADRLAGDLAKDRFPLRLVAAWPLDDLPGPEEFVTSIPCPVEAHSRARGLPTRFDD